MKFPSQKILSPLEASSGRKGVACHNPSPTPFPVASKTLISFGPSFEETRMKAALRVVRYDDLKDYSAGRRYRFVIVDMEKKSDYPSNFLCMLPVRISSEGKLSAFVNLFGDESHVLAKRLLTGALRKEQNSEIKEEIERRLSLLEPQPKRKTCRGCGEPFQPSRPGRYSRNLCEQCLRKRFAVRE